MIGRALRHLGVAVATAVLLIPSYTWIADAWNWSPLDRFGPGFTGLALAWWLAVALLSPVPRSCCDGSGLPFVVLAAVGIAAGVVFDINVLIAAGAVGLGWGLAWTLTSSVNGLLLIPAVVIGLLALPTTTFLVDQLWPAGIVPSPGGNRIKAAVALLLLVAGGTALIARMRGWHPHLRIGHSSYAVTALVAVLAVGTAFRPPQFGAAAQLDDSHWAFSRWLGAEIDATPAERRLYADARLSKRVYAGPGGRRVVVLMVDSDNIHSLHAPEYCLTGGGWQIDQRGRSPWPVGRHGATAGTLSARRGEARLKSVYWFSSASRSTTDLAGLRLSNRLAPNEPFTLYLLSTIDPDPAASDEALRDFLESTPWR